MYLRGAMRVHDSKRLLVWGGAECGSVVGAAGFTCESGKVLRAFRGHTPSETRVIHVMRGHAHARVSSGNLLCLGPRADRRKREQGKRTENVGRHLGKVRWI